MSRHSSAIRSMKVTRTNTNSIAGLGRETAPAQSGKQAEAAAQAKAPDQTQISNLGTYLASAMSGSAAHLAKLGALGAAVSNNQYSVDASVVSQDIIQHSMLFSGVW